MIQNCLLIMKFNTYNYVASYDTLSFIIIANNYWYNNIISPNLQNQLLSAHPILLF